MLPKKKRVSTEMFKVVDMGKTYHHPLLSVRKAKSTDTTNHFAVVVSTKVAKTAVKRNQIRRRIYSIIKKIEHKLPSPFVYLIFVKKDGVLATFQELETALQSLSF